MSIFSGAFKPDPQQIRVTAEQNRLDGFAAIEQAQRALELKVQQQRAETQLAREQRRVNAELREARQQAWAERTQQVRDLGQTIGRRALITIPILAPMVVAWVGQIGFALDTLGWSLAGAVVFAAAWELTTAFAGWMYHQARQQGDSGHLFRAATWLFASSAGAMNYWHALDGAAIDQPTPKAVSYGAMSLVGIALWELYASLIHRQGLRDRGALPQARPRFGVARWVRFPAITFKAWSAAIEHGLTNTEEAWRFATCRDHSDLIGSVDQVSLQVPDHIAAGSETSITDPGPIRSETHSADRSVAGSETHGTDRSETHMADRSVDQVPDPLTEKVPDPGPIAAEAPRQTQTQTGPKKPTRTRRKAAAAQPKLKPLDRIDEARTADAAYLAEHGRHIPAEKLARAMRINKPAALELVKQVRGAQMDIAK